MEDDIPDTYAGRNEKDVRFKAKHMGSEVVI